MSTPPKHPVTTGIVFGMWTLLSFISAWLSAPPSLPFFLALFNTVIGGSMVWSLVEELRSAAREEDD